MKVDFHKVADGARKHSGTICAAVAAVGTITTAIFSGFGAIKCHEELEPEMTAKEKAKVILKAHWKTGVSGAVTLGAIIASDRIHVTNEIALAGAVYANKEKLAAFKDKMKEFVGEDAVKEVEEEIKAETANDKLRDLPKNVHLEPDEFIVYVADAECFCVTTEKQMKDALYKMNEVLHKVRDVRMNYFLHNLGRQLPGKDGRIHYDPLMEDLGWRIRDSEQHEQWVCSGFVWVDYIYGAYIRKPDITEEVDPKDYINIDEPVRNGDIRVIHFTVDPKYLWDTREYI